VKELAGRMLSRQSVRSRLESEQGISLTEFSYQAFQAYDWLRLYQGRLTPEQR
jgi:tyrosyl-tRNA synthetase